MTLQTWCREEIDDLAAFQRQYENDHSWEDLQEDEFGRLLSLVSPESNNNLQKHSKANSQVADSSCKTLLSGTPSQILGTHNQGSAQRPKRLQMFL